MPLPDFQTLEPVESKSSLPDFESLTPIDDTTDAPAFEETIPYEASPLVSTKPTKPGDIGYAANLLEPVYKQRAQEKFAAENPPIPTKKGDLKPASANKVPTFDTIVGTRGTALPADTYDTSVAQRQAQFKEDLFKPTLFIPEIPVNPDDSKFVAAAKEINNIITSVPKFVSSPAGILTLGAGTVAPKTVAGLFAGQQALDLGKQVYEAHKNWDFYTPAEKTKAVVDMVGTGAFTGLAAKGAISGFKPKTETPPVQQESPQVQELIQSGSAKLPLSAKAVENIGSQKTPVTEVKNASDIETPAAVHGDLQPQPIEGQGRVPAQEGGARIQAQAVSGVPSEQGGPPNSPTPEVLLTPPKPETTKDWKVTVQSPQLGGKIPGYVQIDDIAGGKNNWSKSKETLAKEGVDVPDFSQLPQGKYTYQEALDKLATMDKGVQIEAKDHPQVAATNPELLPVIAKDELNLDPNAYKGESIPKENKATGVNQPPTPSVESPLSAESSKTEPLASEPVKVEVAPSQSKTQPIEQIEQPNTTSIKNAAVDQERVKRGLPPAIEPAKREFGKVWDEAMAKIESDSSYQDRLVSELSNKPRPLTDLENAALLHHQIELQNEYGKAIQELAKLSDEGKTEGLSDAQSRKDLISDKLLELYNIDKKVGTANARGLNSRRMMANEDFTLAKMELEKRANKGGKKLTPEEAKQVAEANKRIEETQKRFDEYVAKTDARLAELELNRELNKINPTGQGRVSKIADKIITTLDSRAAAAKQRLIEKGYRLNVGIDPTTLVDFAEIGAAHLAHKIVDFAKWSEKMVGIAGDAIKPYLKSIYTESQKILAKASTTEDMQKTANTIAERIQSGDGESITSQVQKLAKMFVENGIKDRDALIDAVHDVLRQADPELTRRDAMDAISGYGKFRQLSKDEISIQLRDLKGQMQQIAKLEDMQAGKPPLKTGNERRIPSPEESRLIKKVNEAKNQFQIPIDDPNTQLKSSLDTLKTRIKNRTIELQEKLKNKDFSTKPKRNIQMDAEANRLHFEMSKAKADWHKALMQDRLANRSMVKKVFGGIGEVLNTSRAVMTSMDLSAVLRQGGFIGLGHPIRALQSFPAMFRAFASEMGQHAVDQEILKRKNYPLYAQGKLYLSEHGQKLSQMEEAYMSRWADKIPLVAGSQRAYVTFLNKLRADSFDVMANTLAKNKELSPEEVKAIANYINVATGRGSVSANPNALVGLNTIFFAPRYVASRFQLLTGQPLYQGTARTRAMIASEYGRYLAGVGVVYALGLAAGATIENDPRSSDFGKLRFGNTRLDPLSGLSQTAVLGSRLATGETKKANGKIVPIRGKKVPYGSQNAFDILSNFLRSKLSPVFGASVDFASGSDVVGNKVTLGSEAQKLVVPLSFNDIYNAMKEQGVPKGSALAILALFGMSIQSYDAKKKSQN